MSTTQYFLIKIALLFVLVQVAHSWSTPTGNLQWWERTNVEQNNFEGGLLESQSEISGNEPEPQQPLFFIRESLMVDMGKASKILADGFFKDNSNCVTYQFERLETYLSLESGFPKPSSHHQIFVACDHSSGKVIGVAEVDARRDGESARGKNGPYMCNVAVDEDHLRMGIATALIEQCESQVQDWVFSNPSSLSNSLYLKVREINKAAVSMYDKLGYRSIGQEEEKETGQTVLVMYKVLPKFEKSSLLPAERISSLLS